MNKREAPRERFDDGVVFWGAIVGFFLGLVGWLLLIPIRGLLSPQKMREASRSLQSQIGSDPVTQSMEEGKALARRRRRLPPPPDA